MLMTTTGHTTAHGLVAYQIDMTIQQGLDTATAGQPGVALYHVYWIWKCIILADVYMYTMYTTRLLSRFKDIFDDCKSL